MTPAWLQGQRGAALPFALLVFLLVSLLMTPVLGYAQRILENTQHPVQDIRAFYASDAGVEDARWRLVNDEEFRQKVMDDEADPYDITLNGQMVGITVTKGHEPPLPPPPVPAPTSGQEVIAWTAMEPGIQDMDADPPPIVRMSLHMINFGSSMGKLDRIEHILPLGFVYVGDPESEGFTGGTTAVGDPHEISDSPWSEGGVDPYDDCQSRTATQEAGQQRLHWSWSDDDRPELPGNENTATISFDIQLDGTLDPGSYYDSPWVRFHPGGPCGNNSPLQAGQPSSIEIAFPAMIHAATDGVEITSAVSISDIVTVQWFMIH